MDEDGIGLVLARASELRTKITNCIHSASTTRPNTNLKEQEREDEGNGSQSLDIDKVGEREEEEEETESLLNIRDALESLEAQLSSLQVCSPWLFILSFPVYLGTIKIGVLLETLVKPWLEFGWISKVK